jgi:protein gp37
MSDNNWKLPHKLQRQAVREGRRLRVFCGSMCDVFSNDAPAGQRERLWQVIRETPDMDWLLLTKRAPNIKRFLPDDWGDGFHNVWLGVTVEDVKRGVPRVDILRSVPAVIRFLSCEPLLEDVSSRLDLTGIDWIICGGESGNDARQMAVDWVSRLRLLAQIWEVAFFFKQWGGTGLAKGGCLIGDFEYKDFPACQP